MEEAKQLDRDFWNTRWQNQETGWDIGYASPALTEFAANFPNKNAAVLIPGCGNAYEAEMLLEKGFRDITLVDIAPIAVAQLQKKFEGRPEIKVICSDFFQHLGHYDLMLEQTFFCALPPNYRKEYVAKAAQLIKPGGELVGLLFDIDFAKAGPPFGGHEGAYRELFAPYFTIATMERCKNSIPPRAGSELFIRLLRK
ncbi:MAG: methyltransferase domain-containing protein [Bacteroidetes bacterium]|nr:methyltransferase domain-containing protein [Bacteroidota bacterium]